MDFGNDKIKKIGIWKNSSMLESKINTPHVWAWDTTKSELRTAT
jgi:hypothetical protein